MATRNSGTKSYLGAPEPYDASVDDWTAYVRFKHFFLANGVIEAVTFVSVTSRYKHFSYCRTSLHLRRQESFLMTK